MTERERLVVLVKDYHCYPEKTCKNLETLEDCADCDYDEMGICNCFAKEADYLLEKGVIVPPCKMDDKLYTVIYDDVLKEWYISEDIIGEVGKTGLFVSLDAGFFEYIPYSKIGKDYFLNREDAEKALEEMENENHSTSNTALK